MRNDVARIHIGAEQQRRIRRQREITRVIASTGMELRQRQRTVGLIDIENGDAVVTAIASVQHTPRWMDVDVRALTASLKIIG